MLPVAASDHESRLLPSTTVAAPDLAT